MGRRISYRDKNKEDMHGMAKMDLDEKYAIEYLEKIGARGVARVELPDGVLWRKATLRDPTDDIQRERQLLEAIQDADHSVKQVMRLIRADVTAIVVTVGLILFFAGMGEGAGYAGLWIGWVFLGLELLGGIAIIIYIIVNAHEGNSPWQEKKAADRAYQNWLTR